MGVPSFHYKGAKATQIGGETTKISTIIFFVKNQ